MLLRPLMCPLTALGAAAGAAGAAALSLSALALYAAFCESDMLFQSAATSLAISVTDAVGFLACGQGTRREARQARVR